MAFVYSTTQKITSSSYGNIDMAVNIFRGECNRTETGVTFEFGVSFTPCGKTVSEGGTGTWTSNSVAAWYGGVQKFAQMSHGDDTHTVSGTYYYATDMTYEWGKQQQNTKEVTCYSFTANNITAATASVNVTIGVGWADYRGNNKGNLTFSLTIPEFHGDVGTPVVTITDNKNNTFTISGTDGANGANNTATTVFSWGYDTNYSNSGKVSNQALTANASDATKTIYAKAVTTGEHGSTRTATASLAVKNYQAPSAPGKPVITYNKSRLTVKEPWTVSWTPATATNASSPVGGYAICIVSPEYTYRVCQGDIDDEAGIQSCSLVCDDPSDYFAPGDTITATVQAIARNGLGLEVGGWAENDILRGPVSTSNEYLVQNAGVMRAKTTSGFLEGPVYVKVNGAWQEAEIVKVKTASGWQEAE